MAYCAVLITVPEGEKAESLARLLVGQKAAACVNIVPSVRSLYWWEGKVEDSRESLLIAKTDKLKVAGLVKLVKANHPYAVPEVISFKIKEGNRDYLRWISDVLGTPRKKERAPKGKKIEDGEGK